MKLLISMKIHYKNKKIEDLLNIDNELRKKFCKNHSNKILQRMFEIDAADNINNLPPAAQVYLYETENKEMLSINISKRAHTIRLLVKPFGEYDIADYKTITEVEIQEILKTHSLK